MNSTMASNGAAGRRAHGKIVDFGRATPSAEGGAPQEHVGGCIADGRGPDDAGVLLHELNHRLKNSLQSLLSYLSLRARQSRTNNVKHALHDIRKQVIAIAVLHDEISCSATLETGSLLRKIVMHLGSLAAAGGRIDLSVHGPSIEISPHFASPFAMIAAELVWNACKHAFPRRRRGSIVVTAAGDSRHLVLSVRDDGVGAMARTARAASTGLAMVKKIAAQHGGRVKVETTTGAGTCVRVTFSLPPPKTGAGAERPLRRLSRPPKAEPQRSAPSQLAAV
jgi:two-component sensor histidine kinase